jgi:hypothetical protein
MIAVVFGGALAACSSEEKNPAPEVVAARAECHALFLHVVEISPQAKGQDAAKIVDGLPVEATEECVAGDATIRACMAKAPDVAGIRACVPSDEVLGCMAKAANIPSVYAKCWSGAATDKGDAKAAEKLSDESLACAKRAAAKKQTAIAEACVADPHAADKLPEVED